jgi:peptidoglycan/xylan/chitin deacetylase (PgdA/CDA1 family)
MFSFPTRHQSLPRLLQCALAVAPFFLSAAIANAQTPPADSSSHSSSTAHPLIALTFDDLPAHGPLPAGETRAEIATKILTALRDAHVPPTYGFVNGATLESEPQDLPVLEAWRASGNPLGSHTWSHMNLDQNSLVDFEANVTRNEPLLRKMMDNEDWHWFRFPYLAEGYTPAKHDGIRAFLAEHGYKIADVTMSFADYLWNDPYARCVAKADTVSIAQLQSTYLAAAAANFSFYRRLSQSLYKRDIPYVLLMHIGAFDAEMLPKLLEFYRSRGVQFITLPEAERDPFYRVDADPKLPPAPEDLEAVMLKRKVSVPPEPATTIQFDSLCR